MSDEPPAAGDEAGDPDLDDGPNDRATADDGLNDRATAGDGLNDRATADDGTIFEIPTRPERRYPPSGGVEHEGGTAFHLLPDAELHTAALDEMLAAVLAPDRYVRGDFFDFPAPVYLVNDAELATTFRCVVRDGRLELHVLPNTDAAALAVLYERIEEASDVAWRVERHTHRD